MVKPRLDDEALYVPYALGQMGSVSIQLKSGRLLLIGFLRCQCCFRYQAYKYILLFCVYYAAVAHIFLRQNGHDGEYSNHSRIQS